jgi:hypothetical protein
MKIIEHPASFEVISDDGTIVRQFPFDDNASRRAISGMSTKKRALGASVGGKASRGLVELGLKVKTPK